MYKTLQKLYTTLTTLLQHTTQYNALQSFAKMYNNTLYTTLQKQNIHNSTQLYTFFHKTLHTFTKLCKTQQILTQLLHHFTWLLQNITKLQNCCKTLEYFTFFTNLLQQFAKLYTTLQNSTRFHKTRQNCTQLYKTL